MRECGILPGKLIEQDLITFTCTFFHKGFGNQTALLFLLGVSAISTEAATGLLFHIEVEVISTDWAKFHLGLVLIRISV